MCLTFCREALLFLFFCPKSGNEYNFHASVLKSPELVSLRNLHNFNRCDLIYSDPCRFLLLNTLQAADRCSLTSVRSCGAVHEKTGGPLFPAAVGRMRLIWREPWLNVSAQNRQSRARSISSKELNCWRMWHDHKKNALFSLELSSTARTLQHCNAVEKINRIS